MKHLDLSSAVGLAAEFGRTIDQRQVSCLARYGAWLLEEAQVAGGIGPNEAASIVDRHLLDALTYLQPLSGRLVPSLLDIGSGVGLPGIPLAIVLPATRVGLLDRSGRRCQLARRAVRVLDLGNVEVHQAAVDGIGPDWTAVTARASLPASSLLPHLERISPEVGIVGGSATSPVQANGYRTEKIVSRYLNSPRWLLIMEGS